MNIKVLDCTLRDGGRIINCAFEDNDISDIIKKLISAGIDIVEVGFLRDTKSFKYSKNSTFFNSTSEIERFIPENIRDTVCVAFIDFNMFDFDTLEPCNGKSVTGLRVGFTKKQFDTQREELLKAFITVKKMGYRLMVQGVNSLAYNDRELLDLISMLNEVEPYSYGIVDTYGAMYIEDIRHFYMLVDHNLNKNICIDVHSHNNFQLSFAFAQEIISLNDNKRVVIFDATLNGMGKCAGNLNTELICDYLNRKILGSYDFDTILDIIDDYLYEIKKNNPWGYSIPAFMAGIYKSHPNNVIYLTNKYRLNTKDIGNIIFMIDEEKRQKYDYDNIERLYIEYSRDKAYDNDCMELIREELFGKEVLLLVPGHTIVDYKDKIDNYVKEKSPVIISVNFYSDYQGTYTFWGNKKRFDILNIRDNYTNIICSNVYQGTDKYLIVDYYALINKGYKYFDNSTMMLLNLLKKVHVGKIVLAGFDGFDEKVENNFMSGSFHNERHIEIFKEVNEEILSMFEEFVAGVKQECEISFLTPSKFDIVLKKKA